jgi:3-phosphoshikimate 1-carboxyvinyltransferase
MNKTIFPSRVSGIIRAPASKSVAQRAIAIAGIARGVSDILYPGTSQDVQAAASVCSQLGAVIEETERGLRIRGGLRRPTSVVNCRESGLGVRMFSAIAATLDEEVVLTGEGSLLNRPMHMVEQSLHALGVDCSSNNGRLPLRVKGPFRHNRVEIDASESSQVLSGIMIAAPLWGQDLHLHVNKLSSSPYIHTTLQVMKAFGVQVSQAGEKDYFIPGGQRYQATKFTVEGDWSGMAFMLVAAAIAGTIRIDNLNQHSTQADRSIVDILKMAGAIVEQDEAGITVKQNDLKGFEWDATHCPDLFPPLVVLGSNCKGISRIRGVSRLYNKESDRAQVLMKMFGQLGISVSCENDIMTIIGGRPNGAIVHARGDHRMAMAAATAALGATGPVSIRGAEAVSKSYPGFFTDLHTIASDNSGESQKEI